MALSCAMPVNYTPSSTMTPASFIDMYKNLAIKKEEPLSDCEDGEDHEDMNVDNADESQELISWIMRHPQYWTKDEVLDWVYYVVEKMKLDGSKVRGEAYQSITGSRLCRMTEEDFQATTTDRSCGSKLFDTFKSLESHAQIRKPPKIDCRCPITLESINQRHISRRESQPNNTFCVSISINNNNNNNNNNSSSNISSKDTPSGLQLDFQSDNNTSKLRVFGPDNDVKVELGHLGVYPISTDIDLHALSTSAQASSSLSSSLSSSSSKFHPFLSHPRLIGSSSSHLHQYFDEQHQQSLHQQYQQTIGLSTSNSSSSLPSLSLPQLSPILSSLSPIQNAFLSNNNSNNNYAQKLQYSIPSSSLPSPSSSSSSSSSSSTPALSSLITSPSSSALLLSSPSSFVSSSSNNSSNIINNNNNTMAMPRTSDNFIFSCDSPMQSSSSTSSSSSSSSSSVLSSSSSLCSSSSTISSSSLSSISTPLSSTSSISSTVVEISSSVDLMEVTDSDYISDEDLFVPCMPEDALMSSTNQTSGVEKKRSGRKNKSSQGNKGNHLWEFVRDLLQDPACNPRLLKWEDKENGVFRFVQSEAVAQLWGEKKKNPMMTYEKLSRAMRFCRTSGYFESVPKNGKFPKKLCFMFGAKAHGWKN